MSHRFSALACDPSATGLFSATRTWPVNEVLLHALVIVGKSDAQIARLYRVSPDEVAELRQAYDL